MTLKKILLILTTWPVFLVNAQNVDKTDLNTLVKQLNTRYDEQNPILSPDGQLLYFTRANDSLNIGGTKDKGDVWFSRIGPDGVWQKPQNLGRPINDELKNYMIGFSPDGKIMFLNQEKKNPGGLIINDGIAYSVQENGVWTRPTKLSVDYMFNKSEHQSGSISKDGNYMVLSLQSYAARGAEDIYVCTYSQGNWTQPVNLGSVINTAKQEMTPYLSPDNKKLYFSSNGHGGRGGRDIFVSERLTDDWTSWSKPQNLGADVNSDGVELGWFIDTRNSLSYYSTTQNSDGYGDIRATIVSLDGNDSIPSAVVFEELLVEAMENNKTVVLSGTIFNEKSKSGIPAAINLSAANLEINLNATPEEGKFTTEVPINAGKLNINIKSPGFMGLIDEIEILGADIVKDFSLTPLEIGTTITLNKVYFERGTAQLLDDSFAELNRVAEMMSENPAVKIELSGHTDNQGSSKLNLQLSQERVDIVKQYLTEHGIEGSRIRGKGYGGTKPVASNANEETRKLNRRVDFTILKN
jgi:OmpA-OmpF porin, OOP family